MGQCPLHVDCFRFAYHTLREQDTARCQNMFATHVDSPARLQSSTTMVKSLGKYAASDSSRRDHPLAWVGLICTWRRPDPTKFGRFVEMLACLRCLKHSSSRTFAGDLCSVGMNFHCRDISKSQPKPISRLAISWVSCKPRFVTCSCEDDATEDLPTLPVPSRLKVMSNCDCPALGCFQGP